MLLFVCGFRHHATPFLVTFFFNDTATTEIYTLSLHDALPIFTHVEVAVFLRAVLRQLRGHVIVLWDGGSIHKGPDVRALLARCPRLHVESFPGYAPDLNPDEFVWTHFKATLANGRPDNLEELMTALGRVTKKARQRPDLLRSFITASELPALL